MQITGAVGGAGRIAGITMLQASDYTGISDRVTDADRVRAVLQTVIDAAPTQIHPTEREGYLDAIMDDLEDRDGAVWTQWPDDVYLLALMAIRILARNPVGSTTLLGPNHLSTLYHHTALPFPPPASPFSHPAGSSSSPQALEALRILANLLVLHPNARDLFANMGGPKALALALAGKDDEGQLTDDGEDGAERMFLLGRITFLATVDRVDAVVMIVDKEGLLESLVYHLSRLSPIPANFNAISELLKVTMNVLRYYPSKASSSAVGRRGDEGWNEDFDALLQPLLNLFHTIPNTSLAPPLSTVLHTLLSFPFTSHLLPIWHSVPEPPSPASSTGSVRSLIHKISGLGSAGSPEKRKRKSINSRSGSSGTTEESGLGLMPNGKSHSRAASSRSKSPSPPSISRSSGTATRQARIVPTITDTSAFPQRVMKILDSWFGSYMPHPQKADEVESNVMVDEVLPPVLLLLARAAEESLEFRKVFRTELCPSDLDRSPAAGPLETRRSLLGSLLRLMHSSKHFTTRDSAGEFLWSVCDSDAATLTSEIGYGNAAGFLFQKGITAPPPGKIDDIDETPSNPTTAISANGNPSRHPISSLSEPLPQSSDVKMTQEEKEREAERLFVLFERMEKNPLISMKPDDSVGERDREGGGKKGIMEMMRDKLNTGEMEDWARKDEEEERRQMEEEDERDVEEARKEMERYRRRAGK